MKNFSSSGRIQPDLSQLREALAQWLGKLPAIVIGLILLSGIFSAWYTVPAESEAVVTRFGRFSHTVEPGLRFKIPWGIDEVEKIPVKRQLKLEFGFATPGANNPFQGTDSREQDEEKRMVTGDLNVALVEWVVQYRINDPRAFLFNVRDPEQTLRDVSESIMRQVVGDRTVDEVITFGRQDIEFESLKELQELVNRFQMGLSIDQVQLKDVNPPAAVQASFNEVNQAQQERERSINVAKGQFNKAIPEARGGADQKQREAEGYATKRINEAEGDAARFKSVLAEYVKAPEITRRRIYNETMQEVLPRLGRRVILDESLKSLSILPLGDATLPILNRPPSPNSNNSRSPQP